jgi:hypothetical protein
MGRVRAGISALLLAVMVAAPSSGALMAFAPHDRCMALHHACGQVPHLTQCCCRDSGSASQQSGLMPSLHRDLSSANAASLTRPISTAAVDAIASPLAIISSPARPPDLPVLLSNLRI